MKGEELRLEEAWKLGGMETCSDPDGRPHNLSFSTWAISIRKGKCVFERLWRNCSWKTVGGFKTMYKKESGSDTMIKLEVPEKTRP